MKWCPTGFMWAWLVALWFQAGPGLAAVRDFGQVWLLDDAPAAHWLAGNPDTPRMGSGVAWGQGRLFGLPQLMQSHLAASLAWGEAHFRGSWEELGGDLARERSLELGLEYRRGWIVCLNARQRRFLVQGEETLTWHEGYLGLGHTWQLPDGGSLQVLWHPRTLGSSVTGQRPLLAAQVILEDVVMGLRGARRLSGDLTLDLDLYWRLAASLALELRLDPASGALGPGLHLRRGRLLLRTSHLAHPQLGVTHRLGCYLELGHV